MQQKVRRRVQQEVRQRVQEEEQGEEKERRWGKEEEQTDQIRESLTQVRELCPKLYKLRRCFLCEHGENAPVSLVPNQKRHCGNVQIVEQRQNTCVKSIQQKVMQESITLMPRWRRHGDKASKQLKITTINTYQNCLNSDRAPAAVIPYLSPPISSRCSGLRANVSISEATGLKSGFRDMIIISMTFHTLHHQYHNRHGSLFN